MCLSTSREPLEVKERYSRRSSSLDALTGYFLPVSLGKGQWGSRAPEEALQSTWLKIRTVLMFLFGTLPILIQSLVYFCLSVAIMCPGTLRMLYYYAISSNRQWYQYGSKSCRQKLDVYPSLLGQKNPPTLLYFYGGAWIIGYKLFATLLARTLTAAGITVVVADYRNYPQASVPEQVQDVELAVQWVIDHIDKVGGDSQNIVIGGESAGAHLLWMALLHRALNKSTTASWKISDVKGFVSCAAPVHFGTLQTTFDKNRWDQPMLESMFGGALTQHDPYRLLMSRSKSTELDLPPVHLFHGTADRTIPVEGTYLFCDELIQHHRDVDYTIYPGYTHIQANVQGPMSGDHRFAKDVFDLMQEWTTTSSNLRFPEELASKRFCPELLVQIGTDLMPF